MHLTEQALLSLEVPTRPKVRPFKRQLLKWIGNKQRFAHEIVSYFPKGFDSYIEPFLGSGAVLGTLAPIRGFGSDCFGPLVEIWQTLKNSPDMLKEWYAERWHTIQSDKSSAYELVRASFNQRQNGADLLFLCRSCYGGVVRFRQADGYMSTPCGIHDPIHPDEFGRRVDEWVLRIRGTTFEQMDYVEAMRRAKAGDMIYCDPPYKHTQSILYGAQQFSLERLLEEIGRCKSRGVAVALSIDGSKKSGDFLCEIPIPHGLFEREVFVHCGPSMLKRFQMDGQRLEGESVSDRLLLTY